NHYIHTSIIQRNNYCQTTNSASRHRMPEGRSQHASLPADYTHEAHCQMNCCAFTRAVWPQKSENHACFYLYRETIQSMNRATAGETAVFLRDLIELEHGRHSAYSKRHAEDGEKTLTFPQFHDLTSIRRPVIMLTYG